VNLEALKCALSPDWWLASVPRPGARDGFMNDSDPFYRAIPVEGTRT